MSNPHSFFPLLFLIWLLSNTRVCCSSQDVPTVHTSEDGMPRATSEQIFPDSGGLRKPEPHEQMTIEGGRHGVIPLSSGRGLQNKKGGADQKCTMFTTQDKLEDAIISAANNPSKVGEARVIKMCPGNLTVSDYMFLRDLPNPVAVECSMPKKCLILPESNHKNYFVDMSGVSLSFEGIVAMDFYDSVFVVSGDETTLTLKKCEFNNNGRDTSMASVVYVSVSSLNIYSCIFRDNIANYAGAIAGLSKATLHIKDSRFVSNEAKIQGGAIMLMANSEATLERTSFEENKAAMEGGALHIDSGSSVNVNKGCSFEYNQAGTVGGAIYVGSRMSLGTKNVLVLHPKTKFIGNTASSTDSCNNIFDANVAEPCSQ